MKKLLLLVLSVLLITACNPATPVPTLFVAPTNTPTMTPAPTATAIPTATPTLVPGFVTLNEGGPICPEQTVYFRQPMVINHDFKFGKHGIAVWFGKAGSAKLTIDKSVTIIKDPEFWSKITTSKEAGGTYYYITFHVYFPVLAPGTHNVSIDYSIPDLYPTYLYRTCTTLTVLPR